MELCVETNFSGKKQKLVHVQTFFCSQPSRQKYPAAPSCTHALSFISAHQIVIHIRYNVPPQTRLPCCISHTNIYIIMLLIYFLFVLQAMMMLVVVPIPPPPPPVVSIHSYNNNSSNYHTTPNKQIATFVMTIMEMMMTMKKD